jgi:two-component system sensor kinase FixL
MEAMGDLAPRQRQLALRTARTGDRWVELTVTDSGLGIPAEIAPRIFDAFFTTRRNGTGLGLSIARSIVEAHGGWIVAENAPEGGAAFRFTVPVVG